MEEEGDSCEEIVCTLTEGYVVEQRITAGGLLRPSIDEQSVYAVDDYPPSMPWTTTRECCSERAGSGFRRSRSS